MRMVFNRLAQHRGSSLRVVSHTGEAQRKHAMQDYPLSPWQNCLAVVGGRPGQGIHTLVCRLQVSFRCNRLQNWTTTTNALVMPKSPNRQHGEHRRKASPNTSLKVNGMAGCGGTTHVPVAISLVRSTRAQRVVCLLLIPEDDNPTQNHSLCLAFLLIT